jgi:hypothetical protein
MIPMVVIAFSSALLSNFAPLNKFKRYKIDEATRIKTYLGRSGGQQSVLRRCRPSADHFSGIRFDRHCDLIAEMIENKRRKKALGHIPVRQHSLDSTWGCSARAPNFAGLCHRLFERHDDFVSPLDGGNQVEYARGALRRKIGLSVMVRSPVGSSRHSWKGRLAPSIAQRMAPAVICTQAWGHPAAAAPGRPRLVARQPI